MTSGFLNVLKPPGMTSHDVVAVVRRLLPRKTKVGHTGTLDPAAAGVLPLAIGKATKLIPHLPDLGGRMKGYLGVIQLGCSTTTDDLEGEIVSRAEDELLARVSKKRIVDQLERFQGTISQVPPRVSAVRVDGQRAYKKARRGERVELSSRTVMVDRLDLLEYRPEEHRIRIYLECGSGTYVRSIARDLGASLEVGGALAFLLRTHSGEFSLEEAVSLEELAGGGLEAHMQRCETPFRSLPPVRSPEPIVQKGQKVDASSFPGPGLYRTSGGLLRTVEEEPRTAVVQALFGEGDS